MAEPTLTVADVMKQQRGARGAEMEVAWQDFLELSDRDQREFLFFATLFTARDAEWCKKVIAAGRGT